MDRKDFNFEVGAIVYEKVTLKYSIYSFSTKSFFLPAKITRLTKTQFTTDSGNRYNKTGSRIGDKGLWLPEAKDQTEEFKMFRAKTRLIDSLRYKVSNINLSHDLSIEILTELKNVLNKIEKQ